MLQSCWHPIPHSSRQMGPVLQFLWQGQTIGFSADTIVARKSKGPERASRLSACTDLQASLVRAPIQVTNVLADLSIVPSFICSRSGGGGGGGISRQRGVPQR